MVTKRYREPLYRGGQHVAIMSSDPQYKDKRGYIESIDDRQSPVVYTVTIEGMDGEHQFFQTELAPIEHATDWGDL